MAAASGTAIFYAVLIAPGFIAVITAISFAAIEDEIHRFKLLVSSLVSSILIDALCIGIYQFLVEPITSFSQFQSVLFQPAFRVDYVLWIFLLSFGVGVIYAIGILVDVPGTFRGVLQSKMHHSYSRTQPREEFLTQAEQVKIDTSDGESYIGDVSGWSRAGRDRELRIQNPYRYNSNEKGFEPVGGPEMVFVGGDIRRVVLLSSDGRRSRAQRLIDWAGSLGSADTSGDEELEE